MGYVPQGIAADLFFPAQDITGVGMEQWVTGADVTVPGNTGRTFFYKAAAAGGTPLHPGQIGTTAGNKGDFGAYPIVWGNGDGWWVIIENLRHHIGGIGEKVADQHVGCTYFLGKRGQVIQLVLVLFH